MKKRILCILLVLCLGLALLPVLAFTVSDKETIAINNATGTIYFGKTKTKDADSGDPALYRVVAKDENTITLFYDGANISDGPERYGFSGHENWSGSDICGWLNGSFLGDASVFTSAEEAAIATYGTTETTNGHVDIDISQKIVLPSVEEVQDGGTWGMSGAERSIGSRWWLRSPGNSVGNAAIVNYDEPPVYGPVSSDGYPTGNEYEVRPAFKINLSSVLFASAATGGKTGSAGATLGAVSAPGGAQKLTILDSSLTLAAVDKTASTGDTLTLSYTGATAGETLSAIVVNGTGAVTHYGKLAESISAAGTVDVTLPDSFDPSTMSLKVFVEQINPDNLTDYASNPVTVTTTSSPNGSTETTITEAEPAVRRIAVPIDRMPVSRYEKNTNGFVTMLYNRILSRAPDSLGLAAWVERLGDGTITGAGIVPGFIFAVEAQERISEYTNEEFITFLYRALFNREPEEEGFNAWVSRMAEGMTREEVVNSFTQSEEFISLCKLFGITPYTGYTEDGQ